MNDKGKIEKTFSQVKAPEDTIERVYGRMKESNRKPVRSFAARVAVIAAVLALCCVGAFAVAKFGISSHVLPSANGDNQNESGMSGLVIAAPFGDRELADGYKAHHDGIDFAAPKGTPVLAAADGTVIAAGFDEADGNYVKIQHADGYITMYKCLDGYTVEKDAVVSQGEQIGTVGSTGHSTGSHLHFELQKDSTPVDPTQYFAD